MGVPGGGTSTAVLNHIEQRILAYSQRILFEMLGIEDVVSKSLGSQLLPSLLSSCVGLFASVGRSSFRHFSNKLRSRNCCSSPMDIIRAMSSLGMV